MENYMENPDSNKGFGNSGQAFEDDLRQVTDIDDEEEKDEEE